MLIFELYLMPKGLRTNANKNLNTLIYNVFRLCKSVLPNPFTPQHLEKPKHPGPAEEKFSSPLFCCCIRSCSLGYRELRRTEIRMLETAANEHVFYTSTANLD